MSDPNFPGMNFDDIIIFLSKYRDKIDWGYDVKKKRFEFELDFLLEGKMDISPGPKKSYVSNGDLSKEEIQNLKSFQRKSPKKSYHLVVSSLENKGIRIEYFTDNFKKSKLVAELDYPQASFLMELIKQKISD